MRAGDHTYVAWAMMPVVAGTRYYERINLDNAAGLMYQVILSGGAAGPVSGGTTNMDNTMPLSFDADSPPYINSVSALGSTLAANAMGVYGVSISTNFQACARYVIASFTPTAAGFATLIVNTRRFWVS